MIKKLLALGFAVAGLNTPVVRAANSPAAPQFNEVRQVVLEHLVGATDATINRAAVDGLLMALNGRVALVTNPEPAVLDAAVLVPKRRVFDDLIGYVRIGSVETGLPTILGSVVRELIASNKLAGIVLDLRYCNGWDYAAAAGVVDLFVNREMPLLDADKGMANSRSKTNAIHLPVAVLINQETIGSAEALAAVFRQAGVGLLVGGRTAGRAGLMNDYKLSSGQTLRVMTGPIKIGDGAAISTEGVVPDIAVPVGAEAERAYYADPYAQGRLVKSGSGEGAANASAALHPAKRVRLTEAALVRERRGTGETETPVVASGKEEPETPVLQDATLARAVDLLKALAVVRQGRL